ncbi:MAG: CDP-diacylglycerol--glycerol-3-phosphate 3-phosphatidyltransferase [Clostridiales Family XIII bacterium]|jgi:CDP-diacylglycerol--glycerol-3-phosphate 3-phosphatidyltransferase|nr:CDP-diacylglycerol--glycerol-3-phosphate 3-phosphatidyltransferase [Clostridiales Family XIII bacterium]
MNLPNALTLLRVALIPVFIVFLMSDSFYIAAGIFIVASITDALDGHIARSKNLVTNFGKIMDPLADKLLVVSALVCLTELGIIPGWMVIVILAREFTITGLRSVAASSGIVIAAGFSGKLKTVAQMVAITLILLENWPFIYLGIPMDQIVLWIAVALTVYSGMEYIVKNRAAFSMKGDGEAKK